MEGGAFGEGHVASMSLRDQKFFLLNVVPGPKFNSYSIIISISL